jgi:hypothetical protein
VHPKKGRGRERRVRRGKRDASREREDRREKREERILRQREGTAPPIILNQRVSLGHPSFI